MPIDSNYVSYSSANPLRDAERAEALQLRRRAGGDGLRPLEGQDVRQEVHGQVRARVQAAARGGRLTRDDAVPPHAAARTAPATPCQRRQRPGDWRTRLPPNEGRLHQTKVHPQNLKYPTQCQQKVS